MKSALKLAQIQMPVSIRKEDCLRTAEEMISSAPADTDVIMLPEMFCCPYETDKFPVYAEPRGGRIRRWASALAKSRGCYLIAGSMPELGEDGSVYNTSFVFDRAGREIACHRKAHLFDIDIKGGQYYRESDTLSAGNRITTFETEFGTMGLCICFDIRFPEMLREMQVRGARVIFVPAAFNMTTGPMHWELLFRSHAMNNQLYTVGTAPARDLSASYHSWGHSIVCDPWGQIVSQAEEKPGVFVTELTLTVIDAVRAQLPILKR